MKKMLRTDFVRECVAEAKYIAFRNGNGNFRSTITDKVQIME